MPLGGMLPWLYQLTPMPSGLTPGEQPRSFEVDGVRVCPNICFENTVPHLIRRQVRWLTAAGDPPDVLVTITNDGWFWGSSLLDVHLTCGVFRAIELRRPMLIAANTGFSATIDATGRVQNQGPRRAEAVLVSELSTRPWSSGYLTIGDSFAGICLVVTLAAAGSQAPRRRRRAADKS